MDFNGLYTELNKLKSDIISGAEDGLKVGAEKIVHSAKSKPGTYQPAVPPYPSWPKLKKGGSPLLKSGGLRASIVRNEEGGKQNVGVSGYAAIHEMGSHNIPQRAFLGPSVVENKEQVLKAVAEGISSKLK